jgi:hypothetical protein
MATVTVHNKHENAVELRVYDMSDDDGQVGFAVNVTGLKTARRRGQEVVLKPGENDIDADFWHDWVEQNKGTGLVTLFHEVERKEQTT